MPNVIVVNTPGPQGQVGPQLPIYTKLSDYSGSYSYCGYALTGSLTTSNVWTITRITVYNDGSVTTGVANSSSWNDRYTNNYI